MSAFDVDETDDFKQKILFLTRSLENKKKELAFEVKKRTYFSGQARIFLEQLKEMNQELKELIYENESLKRRLNASSRQLNIVSSQPDKLGTYQITKQHVTGHECLLNDKLNDDNSSSVASCAICLRNYNNNELLYWYHPDPTQSSCYHTVHYACSKQWFGSAQSDAVHSCPICRQHDTFSYVAYLYNDKPSELNVEPLKIQLAGKQKSKKQKYNQQTNTKRHKKIKITFGNHAV
jgi:hypothetical protein